MNDFKQVVARFLADNGVIQTDRISVSPDGVVRVYSSKFREHREFDLARPASFQDLLVYCKKNKWHKPKPPPRVREVEDDSEGVEWDVAY